MKVTFSKEEIQVLGQLALEISFFKFNPNLMLEAVIIHEFRMNNAELFEQPQARKRKLKLSQVMGIRRFLYFQPERGDALWDITILGLRNKMDKIVNDPSIVHPIYKQLHA